MPMELTTPKFNKERCLECRYCGVGKGGYVIKGKSVFCDYATITNTTCLKRTNKGETYDLRGSDYNDCLLFKPGKINKSRQLIVGSNYERRG